MLRAGVCLGVAGGALAYVGHYWVPLSYYYSPKCVVMSNSLMFRYKTFLPCFIAILVLLVTCSKNSTVPLCSLVVHDVRHRASMLHNAVALLLLLIVKGSFGKFGQIERVFSVSLMT